MHGSANQGIAGCPGTATAIRLIRFTSAWLAVALVSTASADARGLPHGLEAKSPRGDQVSVNSDTTQLQRQAIAAGDGTETSVSDTAPESDEDCE